MSNMWRWTAMGRSLRRRTLPTPKMLLLAIAALGLIGLLLRRRTHDEGPKLGEQPQKKAMDLWLQPTLLNVTDFKWIQNNESICRRADNDPGDIRIMPVLVHTARSHFEERLAVRKSWGSLPIYKKWDLRLVFLLGQVATPQDNHPEGVTGLQEEDQRLAEEHAKFGDIIVGSFLDTYRNLTYKTMMGYKWVLNFCHDASLVLKVDDDIYLNIVQWLDWVTADLEAAEADTSSPPDVYCKLWGDKPIRPDRYIQSKWYVTYEEFPEEFYPRYCSGWSLMVQVDLMEKVYSVSNSVQFFWIDDVFVTGLLFRAVRDKYDIPLKIRNLAGNRPFDEVARGPFLERDMMLLWKKTLAENPMIAADLEKSGD